MRDNNVYFAADKADRAVSHIARKGKDWFDSVIFHRQLDKIKRSWDAYYGFYYDSGHEVTFGGEQGELVNLPVNHYRNIAKNILNMVTANRPAFQARATNTDYRSQEQTILANGLLDYYMREKRLERYLRKAVELAIVTSAGFIKMEWDATRGEIYDYVEPEKVINPITGELEVGLDAEGNPLKPIPVHEGDVVFKNLSPYDVVFDSTKENYEDNEWVLVRTFKNKFDIAAKFPEMREEIIGLKVKSDYLQHNKEVYSIDETVDIPVYEFFHTKTESMPNGRYILYCSEDIILMDTMMPYRSLPVYRIVPADLLGTPYGYAEIFDLLPMQDCVNSLYSTVMTNQNANGVQSVLIPRGTDVRINQLSGGMNYIEYNAQAGEPKALQLTATAPEIFNFLQMIEKAMETVSGVNSVTRGNPESSLKSGTALALVQSQSLQFVSHLQQSYIQLIEDVGTGLINLLKDFAAAPRIAAITGVNNRYKLKEFTGSDLSNINRVIVDVGNALAQSTAGKVQMASELLQMGLITSPEKYLEVMNTGRLDSMTEFEMNELSLVRAENEALFNNDTQVMALFTDKHSLHIREHRGVAADPKLRLADPALIKRVAAHIQEHIMLLQTTDPNTLALFGEQPLSPPGGTPNSPANIAPEIPPASAEGTDTIMQNPQAAGVSNMPASSENPMQPPTSNKAMMPKMPVAPKIAPNGLPTGA